MPKKLVVTHVSVQGAMRHMSKALAPPRSLAAPSMNSSMTSIEADQYPHGMGEKGMARYKGDLMRLLSGTFLRVMIRWWWWWWWWWWCFCTNMSLATVWFHCFNVARSVESYSPQGVKGVLRDLCQGLPSSQQNRIPEIQSKLTPFSVVPVSKPWCPLDLRSAHATEGIEKWNISMKTSLRMLSLPSAVAL